MNGLDIVILVILAAFVLKGVLRGLLKELCSLVGLVAGGALAFHFHPPLAQVLVESFGLPAKVCAVVAFLALFLATVLCFALIGMLLSRFIRLIFLGGFNRVAGAFFGLGQGVLLLAILLYGISLSPLPQVVSSQIKGSQFAPPFVELGASLFNRGGRFMAERT